ncbi:hypothetical protein CFIMG_006458RA [Ceratocystis fimbriata CBS 114723]|uniref:MARVEL domain-containing protein n=1 Tax=Ceratocystis fimbriata CBS 114723 TaxID=1035309 RepID=A0A2C5WXJ6_9PEZI|nr:hypothetical protein CFIMG_006458RA [Ceratocystis fimbriata CBS 114723]
MFRQGTCRLAIMRCGSTSFVILRLMLFASAVFAEVVAGLSCLTALIYLIPHVPRSNLEVAWDSVLVILWLVLTARFAQGYLGPEPRKPGPDYVRLRWSVYLDMVGLALWTVDAIAVLIYKAINRERRSRFAGQGSKA